MKFGHSKGTPAQVKHEQETVNKAGGVAFNIPDPSLRLMHMVGAMFNEPKYYEDLKPQPEDRLAGLNSEARALIETAEELAKSENWRDLLAIATYAREELHMRTTPVILYAIAAEHSANKFALGQTFKYDYKLSKMVKVPLKGQEGWARAYAEAVMQRADEPRLVFAAWRVLYGEQKQVGGRTICTNFPRHRVKRAIADRLVALPEHLLAKYDADGSPSLKDTIRVCAREHISNPKLLYFVDREAWEKGGDPKKGPTFDPKTATPTLWAKTQLSKKKEFDDEAMALAKKAHATWENLMSQFKSSGAQKLWEFLAPQMGYMALLRNLRNMVESGVDLKAAKVLDTISDEKEVLASKQLPFRFLSAARIFDPSIGGRTAHSYRTVDAAKPNAQNLVVLDALDKALGFSVQNLPKLPGNTAVFIDNSGSMNSPVSEMSEITNVDAANMLGALMALASDNVKVYAFTDRPYPVQIRKADSVLTNMARIAKAGGDGGSTNAYLCPPALQTEGFKADRIILISDMQCWDNRGGGTGASFREAVKTYRKWAGKKTWLHSINMVGTVEAQMASDDPNTNLLSGFSDQTVRAIAAAESKAVEVAAAEDAASTPKSEKRQVASIDYVRDNYVI